MKINQILVGETYAVGRRTWDRHKAVVKALHFGGSDPIPLGVTYRKNYGSYSYRSGSTHYDRKLVIIEKEYGSYKQLEAVQPQEIHSTWEDYETEEEARKVARAEEHAREQAKNDKLMTQWNELRPILEAADINVSERYPQTCVNMTPEDIKNLIKVIKEMP